MIVVAGFGPFEEVLKNPAESLALRVDGARLRGQTIRGVVLPVSYARSPSVTLDLVARLPVTRVIGVGVATRRQGVSVEEGAHRPGQGGRPDIDGALPQLGKRGPNRIPAGFSSGQFARALGGDLSKDAGDYVCNCWLYEVQSALDIPVGFVHVPPSGLSAGRFLAALNLCLSSEGSIPFPFDAS